MKLNVLLMMLALTDSTTLFAQTDLMSSGQNKLLINPAFCAGPEGLSLQEVGGYSHDKSLNANVYSNYSGLSYSEKRFGFGLTNSFQSGHYPNLFGQSNYFIDQTSLSWAYKIKLGTKITLVPALQSSFYTLHTDLSPAHRANGLTFSTGALLDIDKRLTFGAAFYNFAGPSGLFSTLSPVPFTQVYHASALFFKDKKINFQPYEILKIQPGLDGSLELGAYTSYKIFSLQTAYRINSTNPYMAGLSVTLSYVKFGYTFGASNDGRKNIRHEIFISSSPFKKAKKLQRNLMLE